MNPVLFFKNEIKSTSTNIKRSFILNQKFKCADVNLTLQIKIYIIWKYSFNLVRFPYVCIYYILNSCMKYIVSYILGLDR